MDIAAPNDTLLSWQTTLGVEFGEILYKCHGEFLDIRKDWDTYANLFGHSKERVDFLNSCSGNFFSQIERLFFEKTLLSLCRLADSIKSMGKGNLTIKAIEQFMDNSERQSRFNKLTALIDEKLKFARDWRNRRIAHNDLNLKLGIASPLIGATRKAVYESIESYINLFKYIHIEFFNSSLSGRISTSGSSEMEIIEMLFLGKKVIDDKKINDRRGLLSLRAEYPLWISEQFESGTED